MQVFLEATVVGRHKYCRGFSTSMMLLYSKRVRVPNREERLEVILDIVRCSQMLAELDHAMRVALPIGRLGHRQVVGLPNLVEVHEAVGLPDDLETRFNVDGRLQADPGEDARVVEGS